MKEKSGDTPHSIRYPVISECVDIDSIVVTPDELKVLWQDGHKSRYNRFWLRDNCPSAGDKKTAIRHFFLRDLSQNTSIKSAGIHEDGSIVVDWSNEQHVSRFDPAWLRTNCYEESSRLKRKHRPKLWGAELGDTIPTLSFGDLEPDNAHNLELLQYIVDYGVVRVVNAPVEPDGIEQLERFLAPYTSNDFGRIFDLISEPEVWDLSQSSEALDPHSDDPYRYSPPGVRILYCLEASGEGGGESQITNGIAAAERLKRDDPKAFEILSRTRIPYVRYREDPVPQGADVHLRAHSPVVRTDGDNNVVGVRFHERSMDTFDLPPDSIDSYYLALISLSRIINGGEYSLKHGLRAGEAFIFDNHQVLHGRTSFTHSPGRRHLRLCQMDRDLIHSRYRLLLSRHGRVGANFVLATGV